MTKILAVGSMSLLIIAGSAFASNNDGPARPAVNTERESLSGDFQVLRSVENGLRPMSDQELAQIEGQGAQIINTTFFGADAMAVITPAGVINGTAQGSGFPSGDSAQITRSTVTVIDIPFTGQTVVTPSGQLNSFGQFMPH